MNSTEIVTPISKEFLRQLHALAVQLESSDSILQHHWGVHLLEDWKSLLLLMDDEPEPGLTDYLSDGTPAR